MAVSKQQTVQRAVSVAGATTIALAYATNPTAGNLLVANSHGEQDSAPPTAQTVSGSRNGSYAEATHKDNASLAARIASHYFENCAGGSETVTMTESGGATSRYQCITLYELAGALTSGVYAGNANSATGTSNDPDAGSITTAAANSAVIAYCDSYPVTSITAGTGFNLDASGDSLASFEDASESQFPTSTGTFDGKFVTTTATFWTALVVEYQGTSSGTNVNLTGVAGTGSAGSLVPEVFPALTGVVGTSGVGTTVPNVLVSDSGVSGTGSAGSLVPEDFVPLTGVAGTGSAGTLNVEVDVNGAGVSGIGSAGAVSAGGSINVGVTGVQATSSAGSLVSSVGIPLVGVQATGNAGTLTPSISASPALSGVQATGSAGNVIPVDFISLSGVSAAGSAGLLVAKVYVFPLGVQGTGQAGTIGVPSNTIIGSATPSDIALATATPSDQALWNLQLQDAA